MIGNVNVENMNIETYNEMKIIDIVNNLKNGEIKAIDLVNEVLENIKINQDLNAFITVMENDACRKAKEIDEKIARGESLGKLAGIPIAVKDNICVKGQKCTCASKMLDDFIPMYNATVIELLEQEDAIIIGKTNMDEFGMGSTTETSYYGAVKNPVDKNCVAGGSSGGSAVAVAADMCLCALGSDTGGSIRQPSSHCGVVGIKPTYGSVSRYGLVAYASSFDQIGPVTKCVDDAAYVLDIIMAYDKKDSTSVDREVSSGSIKGLTECITQDINGMRIAIPSNYMTEDLSKDIKDKIYQVVEELKRKGAIVSEVDFDLCDKALAAYYTIACAEASSNLSRYDGVKYGHRVEGDYKLHDMYRKSRSEGFGLEVKRRIMLGTFTLSKGFYEEYYIGAVKVRESIKKEYAKLFAEYDVILSLVTPTTAPSIGTEIKDPMHMYLSDMYTVGVNLAGLPAMSVPVGTDRKGLPIGVQIISKWWDEESILRCGKAIEHICNK